MAQDNELTLKLTTEQQQQIKDATGKNLSELKIDFAAGGKLADENLDKVVGGVVSKYIGETEKH